VINFVNFSFALFTPSRRLSVLTKEISLAKVTIEDKEKEMTNVKTSIVSLENERDALESSLSCLTVQNQELQVQLENCKNFNT
jgi:predicted  nucleic acid-binding Zn-ribbon protein